MSRLRQNSQITELIIHCAATPNGKWFTASDIDQWHKMRGFRRDPRLIGHQQAKLKHIGYHFVIGIKGGVESGRNINESGAHAKGHNMISIGTCLIGTDRFSDAQWLSLKEHVLQIRKLYPGIQVLGHCEINSGKVCPGFDVQAWITNDYTPSILNELDSPF